MRLVRRHPWLCALVLVLLVLVLFVGSFGMYLAGEAGRLPWQEDPTRIPITPFAGIPGFGDPTEEPAEPAATASPTAGRVSSALTSVSVSHAIILNGAGTDRELVALSTIAVIGGPSGGASWSR